MRINVYAEELPYERAVECVETTVSATGAKYFGARLYLLSAKELPNNPGDDNRSAITFWGPRRRVARLLRELADAMDGNE